MTVSRILFVDPVGEKGGAEVVLEDLVRGLDRTRFEPLVACLKPGPLVDELLALGIETFALGAHRSRELHRAGYAIAELNRIIRRKHVDLVHGNGSTMLLYGGIAAQLARRPCVWQVYDPLKGSGMFERAFVAIQRRLRPAWTIFGTAAAVQSYRATYTRLGNQSTILPGVDIERLRAGADPCRARKALGIPPDAPIVSMFARLQRAKGHLVLIESAADLLSKRPETRIVICGGALFGLEPDFRSEVEASIKQYGLSRRVLVRGYVSEEEKRDILSASAIVVHPALSEPFGITVIEGMAAGKPVVATDCVGPSMTVLHDQTGLLVPRGDARALTGALMALLDDPGRARVMGVRGYERAKSLYSVEAMVRQVEAIYMQVLSKDSTGNITTP